LPLPPLLSVLSLMEEMRRSRAQRVTTAVAAVSLGAIGFIPLFGGPGYEAALAAGIVLPALAAIATALDVSGAQRPERPAGGADPVAAVFRGIATGLWLAAVGLAVTGLHGLRAGYCDAVEGTSLFLLGPGAGAVMGGVYGSVVGFVAKRAGESAREGRVASRRRIATAIGLSLAGPLIGIVVSLVRFYTSPMVFAFDPFFGFFAGTLYDSVISGLDRLATYRLGSLATCLAVLSAAASLRARVALEGRGWWRSVVTGVSKTPLFFSLALLASAFSVWHGTQGTKLGHFQTASSIRDALGKSRLSARCELVYPSGTPEMEATALARECDGHVAELERFFALPKGERITVFLFGSTDQKGYLMGAATTYIAKPWRREIYIQRNGFPHPVMRHELAHVIAGAFGAGPFRVAGPLHGLIPDPGRIEGVAVAAAQEDELTVDEWAKAMKELELLPPLGRVFKLSFLGEPSSRAYVVAGAFVDWLRREYGVEALKAWYHGASLADVTRGASLDALEARFRSALDQRRVPADVLDVAKARFDQPAIFGRRCPHVVDRLAEEAGAALGRADTERARQLYKELLRLDPHDVGARLGLGTCALREGHVDAAQKSLSALAADPSLGRTVRGRVLENLADVSLAAGRGAEAKRLYDEVAMSVVDSDRLRTLEVKRYAAAGGGQGAIVLHLMGDLRYGREPTRAVAALSAWSVREPDVGIADYLIARLYTGSARYDLAAESLDRALSRSQPLRRVEREAYRLRLVSACALYDSAGVAAAFEGWKRLPDLRPKELRDMQNLVERCTPAGARGTAAALPSAPTPSGTAATAEPSTKPAPTIPAALASGVPGAAGACPEGMTKIAGAEAWIGSARGQGVDDEWPRYRARLPSFCLDRTEETVATYGACVEARRCAAAGAGRVTCTASRSSGEQASLPVNCVDWNAARAACAFRGARLPSEAEWEYAASGGDERTFSWGAESPDGRACWKRNGACAVGSYAPGAFGLLDMTGNLWEWTEDGYGDYPYPPRESPLKVYRGGSWSRRFEKWMRVRLRNRGAPEFTGSHLGFRCAFTPRDVECPAGRAPDGGCVLAVLETECRPGKKWNGSRCAADAEAGVPGCGDGRHFVPGHGCERDVAVEEPERGPMDVASVRRVRSPEYDADCRKFQAARPDAYRFDGGSHVARNAVEKDAGCKNRDVGVGWNSACCP
jgi:formylglycine-generating enzyme required for sulfatase activity